MAFLNAARPLINNDNSLVIRISGNKEGSISMVIEPHVKLREPQTQDAELASLQAALAMPLHLRFNPGTTDLDQELAKALAGMAQARQSTVSALTAYEEAQAEARNQAAIASKQKKDKAPKAKPAAATGKPKDSAAPAAKPLPAASGASTPDAGTPAQAAAPASSTAQQSTIFD